MGGGLAGIVFVGAVRIRSTGQAQMTGYSQKRHSCVGLRCGSWQPWFVVG